MDKKAFGMNWQDTKDPRIKKRNGNYWARFSVKGHRIQESLHTKAFDVAKEQTDRLQNTLLLGNYDFGDEKNNLFEDLWQKFLEDKATGRFRPRGKKLKSTMPRESTMYEYTIKGKKHFLSFFGSMKVRDIDGDVWDQYLKQLRIETPDIKVMNHAKYLKNFFHYLFDKKYVGEMPDIYNPDMEDENDGVGINFTDKQLQGFRDGSKYYPEFHLWIMMAQLMGMRSGEITQGGSHRSRYFLEEGIIRLRKVDTKTGKARNVPIHPKVLPLLTAQLASHGDPYLFPNRDDKTRPMSPQGFVKAWDKLRLKVKVEDHRFHDFRHSYCTRVFANPNLNPVLICRALGMSMETALKTYIHFSDKDLHQITRHFDLTESIESPTESHESPK